MSPSTNIVGGSKQPSSSNGPLVPPPTYGKNHFQNLESLSSGNFLAELAKYSNNRNILEQGKPGKDPYISYDSNTGNEGSEIIMYPSGNSNNKVGSKLVSSRAAAYWFYGRLI